MASFNTQAFTQGNTQGDAFFNPASTGLSFQDFSTQDASYTQGFSQMGPTQPIDLWGDSQPAASRNTGAASYDQVTDSLNQLWGPEKAMPKGSSQAHPADISTTY
eukprot:gene30132-35108_t